ncbi:cellulose binding domain-containing protein [Lentisphaerota bacterium ZTH]|nr:cellulose binding domain-containing protein [Lentisphaerota bacterium]WET06634.1 cellulose binding domain-containing protein [Lentisphaerota bacterium ZTH]
MKKLLTLTVTCLVFSLLGITEASGITLSTNATISDWSTGYQVSVVIKNNTEHKVTSWQGSFVVPSNQSLSSLWSVANQKTESTTEGTLVTFTNPDYEGGGVLEPGAEFSFGMVINKSADQTPGIINLEVTGNTPSPPIAGKGFPEQVFAPYVDACKWPAFSLKDCYEATGQKYFVLAFIVSDSDNEASWGTYHKVLGETYFYVDEINFIRSAGGDVIVSFGGENNIPLAVNVTDPQKLADIYQKVVDTYKLTWIDFDVEGIWVKHTASIKNRNAALKILQANNPDLKIAYCLPVLPTGLTNEGLYVLQNALENNVRVDHVNIMTMNFGDSTAPDPENKMGYYCIESAKSLYTQLQSLYPEKTTEDIWKMIGITPMIGQNYTQSEVVWPKDAEEIAAFGRENPISLLSMWSANRDKGTERNINANAEESGIIQDTWDFTKAFQKFTQ